MRGRRREDGPGSRAWRFAWRAAGVYALFGAAWILVSDRIVDLTTSARLEHQLSTVKGLFFIALSATIVFLAVRRYVATSERSERDARASEEAFRRSEARYRSLVERVPGVVYLNAVDAGDPGSERCVYIGPQLADLLGYEPAEWIEDVDLWLRVVHPEDRDRVRRENDDADDSGEFAVEYRAVHRDGSTVWLHDEAVCVTNERGEPLYWQGVMIDITAQRVADAAVHGLAESLRGVFRASPLPVIVLEAEGTIRHWNPAAQRLFGWRSEEVVGHRLPLVPAEQREAFTAIVRRVLAGEEITGTDVVHQTRTGERLTISLSAAPLRDADGLPEAVVGVLEDVTARRHAEAALEQRAEMLDNVTDAVILSDEAFNVLYWNRGAEVLYGWSASETIGRPAGDFVQLDVDADRLEEILASFRREGMWRGELPHRLRDGRSIPVESQTVARQLRDGTRYVVSVNRDVSERAAVAAALARRTEQQEAVASLALAALADSDLDAVLAAGTKLVAETLEIPLCGVLELAPDGQELLLRSGVGWRDGVIGHHRVAVRDTSLAAYTLTVDEAVIVDDLEHERRFTPPPFLLDHGIVGGAAVVVYGARHPYGVLEALTTERRTFSQDDVRFLRGVAAIVGLAIERARADAALQQAETRYRGLVERGPGVVYLHDTATAPAAVTYVSPQVEAFLGYPRSAWTDDPRFWIDVLHPDDRERIVRADTRAIEAGEDLDLEYRVIASDGREVWVHDHATVITDRAGAPLFRQGLLVDVTDRRRAEDERRAALEQQVRLATRLELLHEVDREIRGATTIVDLCQRTLERLRSLLRADFASIGILDARRGTIDFPAMIHDEEMVVLPASPDVTDAEALELMSREVLRVDDVDDLGSTSAYVGTVRQQGLRSVLSFALYSAGEHVGVLIVGSRAPSAFGEEAEDVGREVASILAIAIRQQRLRDALAERAAELEQLAVERQQMLRRIVRAQEEERERVALELHDGLGQILTSVSLFASDLEDEVPEASRPRASRVNELVRRAIADSRQLVWSLRPPELERLGLVPALRRLAEDSSSADLTVDLHERIGDLRLGPDEEAVVYRVVQEAVHNARKHADASAISILLQQRDGVVSTIVEDNGHGFEPDRVPPGRGLGLIGMRERAELVDGGVVVESAAGAGTRVRLEVPVSASVPG